MINQLMINRLIINQLIKLIINRLVD